MKKRPKNIYKSIRSRHDRQKFPEIFERIKLIIERIFLNKAVLAIALGLIVGSLFGLTSLHLLTNNQDVNVLQEQSANKDTQSQVSSEDTMTKVNLDMHDLYVIQVGLFHEYENAELRKRQLERGKIATFIWERNGEYFLLHSIHRSESNAKEKNEQLQNKSLEAFVKKWDMASLNKQIMSEDLSFIEQYVYLWEQALEQAEANSTIELAKWQELQEHITESTLISEIQLKLVEIIPNLESQDLRDITLLHLIYLLEKNLAEKIV